MINEFKREDCAAESADVPIRRWLESIPNARVFVAAPRCGRVAYPSVTVIDSFNDMVDGGAINYPSVTSLTVTFAGAFSGKAVLT